MTSASATVLPDGEDFWNTLLALRAEGFDIDSGQISSAMALLAAAHADPTDNIARARFRQRVTAVLATSADSAARLGDRLATCHDSKPVSVEQPTSPTIVEQEPVAKTLFLKWAMSVTIVAALFVAILAGYTYWKSTENGREQTGAPAAPSTGTGLSNTKQPGSYIVQTTVVKTTPVSPLLIPLQLVLLIAPPASFLAWLLRAWYRRRARLTPFTNPTAAKETTELSSIDATAGLFVSPEFRKSAQALHRHMRLPSQRLNAKRTVALTVRRAGYFTPAYAERRLIPNHLVLIERKSIHDHLATLFELAVQRMRSDGVEAEVFYYSRDPQLLVTQPTQRDRPDLISLQELSRHFDTERIVVLGPTDAFLNPFSRAPMPWIEDFTRWSQRAILHSGHKSLWDPGEVELSQTGWLLGTARQASLPILADRFSADVRGDPLLEGSAAPFRRRPLRDDSTHVASVGEAKQLYADVSHLQNTKQHASSRSDYAIVIGIDMYDQMPSLSQRASGARLFENWLVSADGGALPRNQVMLLTGRVTLDQINQAFQTWADQASLSPRRGYVYFAGHIGRYVHQMLDPEYVLFASDTDLDHDLTSAVLFDLKLAIEELADLQSFQELVVIIDGHVSTISYDPSYGHASSFRKILGKRQPVKQFWVVASTSLQDPWNSTVPWLTGTIVDSLFRGYAADGEGNVSTASLADHIRRKWNAEHHEFEGENEGPIITSVGDTLILLPSPGHLFNLSAPQSTVRENRV